MSNASPYSAFSSRLHTAGGPYHTSQPQIGEHTLPGRFPSLISSICSEISRQDDEYLQATLAQIDHLANEDVEMQAPLSEFATFLVVDTNILLHHFEVLAQFVDDIEKFTLPVIVVVPGAVVHELDGQKNRDGLAWFARRATAWLLEKIRERKSVKGQAQEETCKSTGNWKIKEHGEISNGDMFNDSLILDCCMYFGRGRLTLLCSADNNLCILSQSQGIPTVTPSRFWSSREIVHTIYGDRVDSTQFGGHKESYRNARDAKKSIPDESREDDSMIVDDEDSLNSEAWESEHPINMLHAAVVDHFTRLLVELVGKVGGDEVRQRSTADQEANLSRHAPRRRHFTEWTVSECIRYLTEHRRVQLVNPRPEVFLLRAYRRDVPGSRTGREWSRQDWRMALKNLERISVVWDDISIRESLVYLEPHVNHVFSLSLRAT